jgi:hypothetical protein
MLPVAWPGDVPEATDEREIGPSAAAWAARSAVFSRWMRPLRTDRS